MSYHNHVKLIMGQLMALVTCRLNLCGSEKCVARFTTTKLTFAAISSKAVNSAFFGVAAVNIFYNDTSDIKASVIHSVSSFFD